MKWSRPVKRLECPRWLIIPASPRGEGSVLTEVQLQRSILAERIADVFFIALFAEIEVCRQRTRRQADRLILLAGCRMHVIDEVV